MLTLIAHRGNINGPSADENNPALIREVLGMGYNVEIDVWFIKNQFWLGHDEPTHKITPVFLRRRGLWCHAKDSSAMLKLIDMRVEHVFWHQTDDFALTTSNHLWVYPGRMTEEMKPSSISVMPEILHDTSELLAVSLGCFGVCSDYVKEINEKQIAHI